LEIFSQKLAVWALIFENRLWHGYGNTRGVLEKGCAGTGTVYEMPTRGHTATLTRGIAGLYGYKVKILILFYLFILQILFTTWGGKVTIM
jgi:hypothetical protein